jgi:hypothetical protein
MGDFPPPILIYPANASTEGAWLIPEYLCAPDAKCAVLPVATGPTDILTGGFSALVLPGSELLVSVEIFACVKGSGAPASITCEAMNRTVTFNNISTSSLTLRGDFIDLTFADLAAGVVMNINGDCAEERRYEIDFARLRVVWRE